MRTSLKGAGARQAQALLQQTKRLMGKNHPDYVDDFLIDAEWVVRTLEDASRTLAALPHAGHSTALTQPQREVVREFVEAYGYGTATNKAPVPVAAKITAMDSIFAWLNFVPQTRIRRIIAARSITHRVSEKPLSWKKIADGMNAHPQAVQNWHGQGIGRIVVELNRVERGLLARDAFKLPPL